jgi:hypothetical protein
MDSQTFEKILIRTAFSCMTSDGKIDDREVLLIRKMLESNETTNSIDINTELNILIEEVNTKGKDFFLQYFEMLSNTHFNKEQELKIIDVAINTIKADDLIEYSEIKFFKNIRHRLKINDESILSVYPDMEMFLEKDIKTSSFIDTLTDQYFDSTNLPLFDLLKTKIEFSKTDSNL